MLTLKSVHYSARLSEETLAFDAVIYWNGKKVGRASNHGTGGPTDFWPENPTIGKALLADADLLAEVNRADRLAEEASLAQGIADKEEWRIEFATKNLAKPDPDALTFYALGEHIDRLLLEYLRRKDEEKQAKSVAKWAKKYADAAALRGLPVAGYVLMEGSYHILAGLSRTDVKAKLAAKYGDAEVTYV